MKSLLATRKGKKINNDSSEKGKQKGKEKKKKKKIGLLCIASLTPAAPVLAAALLVEDVEDVVELLGHDVVAPVLLAVADPPADGVVVVVVPHDLAGAHLVVLPPLDEPVLRLLHRALVQLPPRAPRRRVRDDAPEAAGREGAER